MEDAKVMDDSKPLERPRLLSRPAKPEVAPSYGSSEITADTWSVKAVGGVRPVENSINHNVQLCVVQMPNNERAWHINNFNTQGKTLTSIALVGFTFHLYLCSICQA